MNDMRILNKAEQYLEKMNIEVVSPGEIGERTETQVEVIFIVPLALRPDVVIDPPDVRVWVNKFTGEVTLIYQM